MGANQNEEAGHLLAYCFIKHNRIPNVNALLRLYLTKAIRWSINSVRTLLHLCKRIPLPEDVASSIFDSSPTATPICDRTRLLEWLLNAPWQKLATRLPVDDICTLSVDIILSSRYRQNVRMELASDSRISRCSQDYGRSHRSAASYDIHSTDISQLCYSSLAFKAELLVIPRNERIEKNSRITPSNTISCVQSAFNFLKKRLHDILQEESSNDEIYVILMKLVLLSRLLSALKQFGILAEDTVDCPLVGTLQKYLISSFEVLANIDSAR